MNLDLRECGTRAPGNGAGSDCVSGSNNATINGSQDLCPRTCRDLARITRTQISFTSSDSFSQRAGDSAGEVRIAAAQGLNNVDAPLAQAVQVLIELATKEPPVAASATKLMIDDNCVATLALEALGEFEEDAALAYHSRQFAGIKTLAVRLEATTALGRIGRAHTGSCARAFQGVHDTEMHSIPFVHRNWCVSDNAATALELIGEAAVPTLIEALRDQDPRVCTNAARSNGIPVAVPRYLEPLALGQEDRIPLFAWETAKALRHLGTVAVDAAPALVRLLFNPAPLAPSDEETDEEELVRHEALLALLSVKPNGQQVMPSIVESLEQADEVTYEMIAFLRHFPELKRQ